MTCEHTLDLHLADMQVCHQVNVHICPQFPCTVFHNAKKLEQHRRQMHPDTQRQDNLTLADQHITHLTPTNTPTSWDQAFQFISANVAPDPANFRCGIQEKIPPSLRAEVVDVFVGLLFAYEEGSKRYEGSPTPDWNARGFVFLWLISHMEMLLLGPQKDKSESIAACVAR